METDSVRPESDRKFHYAPESDDYGVCGLPGFLVERPDYVTCEWCKDTMRADNVQRGLRADGSPLGEQVSP